MLDEEENSGDEREVCIEGGRPPVRTGAPPLDGNRGASKSIFEIFRKEALSKRTFTDVVITAAEERNLSEALTQQLTKDNDGRLFLPTLRFTKPSKPHNKSVMPKPLSADQLYQNKLFVKQCRITWKRAQREMHSKLGAHLEKVSAVVAVGDRAKVTATGLWQIGVNQLAKWSEEDEEAKRQTAKEDQLEREDRAKITHAGFVKRKDRQLIRVPQVEAHKPPPSAPRFDLSNCPKKHAPVRPRIICSAETTLDLMRGQGMTTLHALGRGINGIDGDLEKSRRQLLQKGYVLKANFDDPQDADRDDFNSDHFDATRAKYTEEHRRLERERRSHARVEFDRWTAAKQGREGALHCLKALHPPALVERTAGAQTALRYWRQVGGLLKAVDGSLLQEWIEWSRLQADASFGGGPCAWSDAKVGHGSEKRRPSTSRGETGRGDKPAPSRELFEWALSLGVPASPAGAAGLWCALSPRGCDINRHPSCGGVSALRATLLKVLKSGLNFSAAFARLKRRVSIETQDGTSELLEKNLMVTSKDFQRCIRDGGLFITGDEARLIIDCVDAYQGQGTASFKDLFNLVGHPIRPGDVQRVLRGMTRFEATCPETGMPNAYRVSANPSKPRAGPCEVDVTLANGEVRRRWTNPELLHRRELLCKLGMISDRLDERDIDDVCALDASLRSVLPHKLEAELDTRQTSKKRSNDDDSYEDYEASEFGPDFDAEESLTKGYVSRDTAIKFKRVTNLDVYGKWFETATGMFPTSSQVHEFGVWGKPRRAALDALLGLSEDARCEERLRVALCEGVPPGIPDLWAATPKELENEGVPVDALLTRLVLRWRPTSQGIGKSGPVAFFSLEFSGALGSRAQRENRFTEIARDPPSARDDAFAFQHVVSGLEPNTTYVFRLRAFNSFGPGPYTWQQLTTPPMRPMQPMPIKVGPRGVLLRWKIPEALEQRAAELKRSFYQAAEDDTAAIEIASKLRAIYAASPEDVTDGFHRGLTAADAVVARRVVWLELIDEQYRPLLDFLRRAKTSAAAASHLSYGVGHGATAKLSLLDVFETSSCEIIEWSWIRERLASTAEIDGDAAGLADRGLVSTGEAARMVGDALAKRDARARGSDSANATVQRVQQLAAPTTYVLERCRSERQGDWEEVLRTRFGEAAVNGLEPNVAYQFRVRAVNVDGATSHPGRATVVNTLLDAPAAPQLALVKTRPLLGGVIRGELGVAAVAGTIPIHRGGGSARAAAPHTATGRENPRCGPMAVGSDGVGGGFAGRYAVSATSVKLAWTQGTSISSAGRPSQANAASDRILAEWTGVAGDDEGAVSLEAVFRRFDRGREGVFAGAALPDVLTRLGAHRTHGVNGSALRAVWDELRDATRDVAKPSVN